MDASNNDTEFNVYLAKLSPSERAEALAAAAAAKRAEERAEQRELERAIREKEEQRRREKQREDEERNKIRGIGSVTAAAFRSDLSNGASTDQQRLVYIPKRKRKLLDDDRISDVINDSGTDVYTNGDNNKQSIASKVIKSSLAPSTTTIGESDPVLSTKERLAVAQTYLGKSATEALQAVGDQQPQQKKKQLRNNKKATFKFRWDETDDTSNFDDPDDPIYAPLHAQSSNYASIRSLQPSMNRQRQKIKGIMGGEVSNMVTVMEKPIDQMTPRDWRILRENFEITVRGGQAPPPMRSFAESPAPYLPQVHPTLLDAIYNVFRFKEPSPIQRQAIPIGLQRRDLIGISETGSGKTLTYALPVLNLLKTLEDQGQPVTKESEIGRAHV